MGNNRVLSWLLVFVWMLVIFMFSHQPADISSEMSAGILSKIMALIDKILPIADQHMDGLHRFIRKSAHFSIYLVLGILIYNALMATCVMPRIRYFVLGKRALILGMFYAMTDEIHQLFIVGRSAEFRDVMIDSMGVLCGVLLFYKFYIRRTLHRY